MISVLFCDPEGTYSELPDLDLWGEERDARRYLDPNPVVAHPPCNLWVNFAALNFARYGGEHNRPGNDGGCFATALANVRRTGGVLEHPASSKAWKAFDLKPPSEKVCKGWRRISQTEWTCEVHQAAYGHFAQKKTWLFYASPSGVAPFEMRWEKAKGTHQIGWFDRKLPTLGKKAASSTPRAFAEELVRLARHSRGSA